MNKARLIITAINVEKITQAEAARRYGVSPGWVSKLLHRHRTEGEAAFTPKSRRPHNTPTATQQSTIDPSAATHPPRPMTHSTKQHPTRHY